MNASNHRTARCSRHARLRRRPVHLVAIGVAASIMLFAGCSTSPSDQTTFTAPSATVGAPTAPGAQSPCVPGAQQLNQVYRDLPGVDPNLVSLDVFQPDCGTPLEPSPIVVFVHGGGFRNGDKTNKVTDKVRVFNEAGWVFVSANYRLVGDPESGPDGATFPAQADDLAAAVEWLQTNASSFDADPTRIALIGHSAGAFLVAQQGTNPSYLIEAGADPSSLRCVVPLDTETFDIEDQIAGGGNQEAVHRATFGDDPVVWEQASPQTGANAGTVTADFLLVTRGGADRAAGNQRFANALATAGVSADVVNAEPLSHLEVNAAVGVESDQIVTPPLMEFLDACFAAP